MAPDGPVRARALRDADLGAETVPEFEALVERVRRRLNVPVSLVSLIERYRQVFPGMSGLPEPWATRRSTPLSHSLCQHVVSTGRPLLVEDARRDPLAADLDVRELGVVAYAGVPLTDDYGTVLGSLCAIDDRPRQWTTDDVETLRDLALACSTEIRLRSARLDLVREQQHRDQLERALREGFERSQTLLFASEAMTHTTTVDDVRGRVSELVKTDLTPAYVGVVLLDGRGWLRRPRDGGIPASGRVGAPWDAFELSARVPSATALRERRVVHYPDRASFDADHAAAASDLLRDVGWHAVLAAPLFGAEGAMGSLVFGWETERRLAQPDLMMVATIASYAAQALDRARFLQHRISVAEQMQQALLTTLPDVPGLEIAARYEPADARETVGGDWYDVALMEDPSNPDDQVVTVSVGDIIGHSLEAVILMGQVRSMLRQAACDHPAGSPSRIVSALEDADARLGLEARGTAVLAHLRRSRSGRWSMVWTNAGHPPPILVRPDGSTELLEEHGPLFGFPSAVTRPRTDQRIDLAPGCTVVFYTDGLIERTGRDLDAGIDDLRAVLGERPAGGAHPVRATVDRAVTDLAPAARDDVVVLAIRISGAGRP